MKTFPELPDDARAEWREDPVTQAFIVWLKTEANAMKSAAIESVKSVPEAVALNYHGTTLFVGKASAFDLAVDTATRETFE